MNSQEVFTSEIVLNFRFIFTDHSGKIIPTDEEYPPTFDNAIVFVSAGCLRFCFIQDRGERRVEVAPMGIPGAWQNLNDVLAVISPEERRPSWISLKELSEILRTHFSLLQRAFSKDEYQITNQRLLDVRLSKNLDFIARFNSGKAAR